MTMLNTLQGFLLFVQQQKPVNIKCTNCWIENGGMKWSNNELDVSWMVLLSCHL